MKNIRVIFALVICVFYATSSLAALKKVTVKQYGARGDGKADDTRAITNAIIAADTIVFPKGTYNIKGPIVFRNLKNKTIIATGAIIQNTTQHGTLVFDKGNKISIIGGSWVHRIIPSAEGPQGNEHTLTFIGPSNIKVQRININGSAQMGICMIGVIGGTISGNTINNCFRDGIYSHYSAKLTITRNKLSNIKDDAISMHDYGLNNQKPELLKANLKQAGHSVISYNTATNVFQGFSSIGCQYLTINNNTFTHTIAAGIIVFNSATLFKGSTARVNYINIHHNVLNFNGGTQTVLKRSYNNGGQLGGGRAALMVTAFDEDNLINNPKTRLNNITVSNNVITNSYVNGAYIAEIDGLTFKSNSFTNCNIDQSRFSGRVVEITDCTTVYIDNNTVTDNRTKPKHDAGYQLKNVKGKAQRWLIKGHGDKDSGYIYDSVIK